MDDFSEYKQLADAGTDAHSVFQKATQNGLNTLECLKMLRAVYNLSFRDAKEVMIQSRGYADNLEEHQHKLSAELQKYIDSLKASDELFD